MKEDVRTDATEPAPHKGNGKTRYTITDIHKLFSKYFGKDYDMQTAMRC
jgi:hypothetical protein